MTDHRRHSFPGASPVNIAIPPPHRAFDRTEIGPGGIEEGLAKGGATCLITDQGRIDIPE